MKLDGEQSYSKRRNNGEISIEGIEAYVACRNEISNQYLRLRPINRISQAENANREILIARENAR